MAKLMDAISLGASDTPAPRESTVELLRRWYQGDRAALEELLTRHLDALHAYVRSKLDREFRGLRREEDSMDLVQGTFLRMLDYLPPTIPDNGAQFLRLMCKIVLNRLRNDVSSPATARRNTTRASFGDSVVDLRAGSRASPPPDLAAASAERQAEVRAYARIALEFLKDEQDRELVRLREIEEYSWDEIGQELGLSPDAARMRYPRLMAKVANHIRVLREGRVDDLLDETGD